MPARAAPRPPKKLRVPSNPLGTVASWLVGAVALVLIGVSLASYFFHRRQLDSIAAEHLRLIVTGPGELVAGCEGVYGLTTTTVTGDPLAAQIELTVTSPSGKLLIDCKDNTDDRGRLQMTLPANMTVPDKLPAQTQLKVVATRGTKREEMKTALTILPTRYTTRLATDRTAYRPGDTVYYRSLTLARVSLAADRPAAIHFEVLDPKGAVMQGSPQEGVTDHGAGNGAFLLPNALAEGRYTLVARSLDSLFSEEKLAFRIVASLPLTGDDHASASMVPEGVRDVGNETAPTKAARKPAAKPATNDAGEAANHPTKIAVHFYPEGGDLVDGVANRVYFVARDASGRSVAVSGTIDDSHGDHVAMVDTLRDGRGTFSFTPATGETYHLKISKPTGQTAQPALPAAVDRKVVLNTGTGVFDAGAPLDFNLRATKAGIPLVVAATCRGAMVGQQALVTTTEGERATLNPVVLPLDEQVGGVIRLTVYDYSANPPRPVAERLVYRRISRRLKVTAVEPVGSYAPGKKVRLTLAVSNEKGDAVSAAIATSVIASPPMGQSGDQEPDILQEFCLDGDIRRREDLAIADAGLSDGKDAALAMDLLLGTQDGRRSVSKTRQEVEAEEHAPEQAARLDALDAGSAPPAMFDNLNDLRSTYEESLSEYRAQRTWLLNTLIMLSFFGSLGLALFVTMLVLMKIVWGSRIWLLTIVATLCCLVVGAVSTDPSRMKSVDAVAVAFASYNVPPPAAALTKKPADGAAAATALPVFAVRDYDHASSSDALVETLAWHPLLLTGADGHVAVTFQLPEKPGTFHVRVDAHGEGRIGASDITITSRAAK